MAPEALAETKALAMESSFGGMAVDDDAYARLVQMHSAKRQTGEASEGLASFAEKRAANWGKAEDIRSAGHDRLGRVSQNIPTPA